MLSGLLLESARSSSFPEISGQLLWLSFFSSMLFVGETKECYFLSGNENVGNVLTKIIQDVSPSLNDSFRRPAHELHGGVILRDHSIQHDKRQPL